MKDIRGQVALTTEAATTLLHVTTVREDLRVLSVEEGRGQESKSIGWQLVR